MRPRNSSIFSSDRSRSRAVLATCVWTLVALVIADAAIGLVYPQPHDVRRPPGGLSLYFDYGRSIEGKLAAMIGPDDARSAPILLAGWIDRDCDPIPSPPPGKLGMTIYGMSFTNHVADQLARIDPGLAIARYAGPAAGPNHSYACFRRVSAARGDPNRIQVLGVLASSLPRLLTLSGASTTFEQPQPFTYPRYRLDSAGRLVAEQPVIRSPEDLRDPAKRARSLEQLAADDAFYDPLLVRGSWADRSVFLRLVRRGYAQASFRRRTSELVSDGKVFRTDLAPPLRAMLLDFAGQARGRGQVPVILLLQDRGYGSDSLYRLVGPALEQAGVRIVRSDRIAPATDPRSFLPDGHFTPKVDAALARALLRAIGRQR